MKKIATLLTLLVSIHVSASVCDHALSFAGGAYVDCGSSTMLTPSNGITVEAWIYLGDTLSNMKIAGTIDPFTNSGYEMGVDAGQLYCELKDVNGTLYDFKAGIISGYTWTHVAFTYSVGDAFKGYINGTQVYTEPAGTATIGNSGSTDFIVGAAPWDQSFFNFIGNIDEIRVYSSVRTQNMIATDMRIPADTATQNTLLGYWRFLEGTGTTTDDNSGNGNIGTLSGMFMPTWMNGEGPYNQGNASSNILLCCSPVNFTNEKLIINPSQLSVPEIFVVSKINCDPNVMPAGSNSYASGYWVVDRYVQGLNYMAELTFIVDSNVIGPNDQPNSFILYHRPPFDIGLWGQVGAAGVVDAATHRISFSVGPMTGQFMVGSNGNTILNIESAKNVKAEFYPNPADNFINVRFKSSGNYLAEIRDLQGRKVFEQTFSSATARIDVSGLNPGMYIIVVNGSYADKIIINR